MVGTTCILEDVTGWHRFTPAEGVVAHDVSSDGKAWFGLPPALAAGPENYDSQAITAVAVVCAAGGYWMYYAANDAAGRQRILLANSTDLLRWDKYPQNPVVHALPHWSRSLVVSSMQVAQDGGGWQLTLGCVDLTGKPCEQQIVYASTDLLRWILGSGR